MNSLESEEQQWNQEKIEFFQRKVIAETLRMKPSVILGIMMRFSLYRMLWFFNNDKFGVLSTYKPENSKRRNLEMQLKTAEKLKNLRFHSIAHIGFWEGIDNRCLFVPRIDKKQMKASAQEFGLEAYIWGKKRIWQCYETSDDSILATDNNPRIIYPDFDFLIFSRITTRKRQLNAIIRENHVNCTYSKSSSRKATFAIKKELADLGKLENELITHFLQ